LRCRLFYVFALISEKLPTIEFLSEMSIMNTNPIKFASVLMIFGALLSCNSNKTSENDQASGGTKTVDGMVWIEGGSFWMGTDEVDAYPVERPAVKREVKGFWMDETEVTNAQFTKFVNETGYITVAERKIDWEELKKQLPPDTPKLPEEELVPGSLVLTVPVGSTLKDPTAQSPVGKTTRSSTLHLRMRKPMPNGQEKGFQLKPSGNTPPKPERKRSAMPGGLNSDPTGNSWPILFKVIFPTKTLSKTNLPALRPSKAFRQMVLAFSI
jgi:hypothetical protein